MEDYSIGDYPVDDCPIGGYSTGGYSAGDYTIGGHPVENISFELGEYFTASYPGGGYLLRACSKECTLGEAIGYIGRVLLNQLALRASFCVREESLSSLGRAAQILHQPRTSHGSKLIK